MAFSLPSFIRLTDAEILKNYLAAQRLEPLRELPWDAGREKLITALVDFIEALDVRQRDRVYRHFEQVEQLVGEVGQRALRTAFATNKGLLSQLMRLESDRGRGLSAFLEDEGAFERALAFCAVDLLRVGRSYRGYALKPPAPEWTSETSCWDDFRAELEDILAPAKGIRRRIQTESFERARLNKKGEVDGRLFQVSVFIEGNPETQSVFDVDGVSKLVMTPALEAAILYDAGERRLEVAGKGGKAVLDQLASAFTRHILVSEERPEGIVPLRYNLERLKRPQEFVFEPSDALKDVRLTLLKLHGDDAGHARVTLELGPEADIDIWAAADAWFAETNPLRVPGWRVYQAQIKVGFHKAPGERREKTIKIDLRFPHGCNLKDQIERERLLAEKYLKLWGLVDGISGTSSEAA